jgi:hypothetical protein
VLAFSHKASNPLFSPEAMSISDSGSDFEYRESELDPELELEAAQGSKSGAKVFGQNFDSLVGGRHIFNS